MVITVDGDYGGGGREVARILAQMTGYTNYDDDQMVLAAAREAGIDKIVVKEGYPDEMAVSLLAEAGKRVIMLKDIK